MEQIASLITVTVTLLILFAPFAIALRAFLFYALLVYIMLWWAPSSRHEGVGHTIGMLIVGTVLFAQFALFVARALVREFRAKGVIVLHEYPASPLIFFADFFLACSLGGLIGVKIFIAIAWKLNATDGGFMAHYNVAFIGFVIFIVFLWMLMAMFRSDYRPLSVFAVSGSAAIFLSLAVLSALGALYPRYVISQAAQITRNDPYCLILENRGKTAETLEELTFFTMDKKQHTYHVALIVDRGGKRAHYYWSYRYGQFVNGNFAAKLQCDPIPQFAASLTRTSESD